MTAKQKANVYLASHSTVADCLEIRSTDKRDESTSRTAIVEGTNLPFVLFGFSIEFKIFCIVLKSL